MSDKEQMSMQQLYEKFFYELIDSGMDWERANRKAHLEAKKAWKSPQRVHMVSGGLVRGKK